MVVIVLSRMKTKAQKGRSCGTQKKNFKFSKLYGDHVSAAGVAPGDVTFSQTG